MKPNHIVFTTIYEPAVLLDYQKNIARYGHLDSTVFWVVGDRKTPPECRTLCEEADRAGLETHYLDIEEQDRWGKRFPEFYKRIPYNNETRRNIGYLFALETGCERLISIDDDNYPTEDDFIGGHERTGVSFNQNVLTSTNNFYNICDHLTFNTDQRIFPRGYPFELRHDKAETDSKPKGNSGRIGATAGLWLQDPDVDATTWINQAPRSIAFTGPDVSLLDKNTWSPINTQNTSVVRELIPAFLCIPMGSPVPGGRIERYGDIWGGYFLQAVSTGLPWTVAFGRPLVEHRRNPHNYLNDLRHEFWGMILTDWLVTFLKTEFKPSSTNIFDRVLELSNFLEELGNNHMPEWCPEEVRHFIESTARTQRAWVGVCQQLM